MGELTWYRRILPKTLRLTLIVMLASDQGAPYCVFLGLHDVFHYRKSHIPLHTGCFMTLTSRLAGYGIILHVCCSKTPPVDEYGDTKMLET